MRRGRMRSRSPSEDEETLEYRRRESSGGVIFEEMVRQLAAPLKRTSRKPNPAAVHPAAVILHIKPPRQPPNVFEQPPRPGDAPPPWSASTATPAKPRSADSEVETNVLERPSPRARVKRGLKVPSLLFIMSLGIGYGLGQDPAARASIVTQVRAAAAATIAFVDR